jgi:gliding motility-associated-like protein
MIRGFFVCLALLTAVTLKAQETRPVLVNGVPVINPVTLADTLQRFPAAKIKTVQTGNRTQNLCGVTASFTPGVDSFFSQTTPITFTSNSINATGLQWLINGFNYYVNTSSLTYYFQPGLYQVSLVASNGNCRDTFSVVIVCSGNAPGSNLYFNGAFGLVNFDEEAAGITATPDSGYLVAGKTMYKNLYFNNGILAKISKKNCIEWTRMLTAALITKTCSLKDGGYLVGGTLNTYTSFLMRLDRNGNQLWAKTYGFGQARFIVSGFSQLYEMNDGSLVATTSPFSNGFSIVKMDPDGNVIWDRFLQKEKETYDYTTSSNIVEWKNKLYVTGTTKVPDTSLVVSNPFNSFFVKLDPETGQTIFSRMYQGAFLRSNFFRDMHPLDSGFLVSALNYYTDGGGNVYPSFHWIDSNGVLVKSIAYQQKNYYPHFPAALVSGVTTGGSPVLFYKAQESIGLQPGFINHFYFLKVSDSTILSEQSEIGGPDNQHNYGVFNGRSMTTIGHRYTQLMPWMLYSKNITLTKRDTLPDENTCSGNTQLFEGHAFHLDEMPLTWAYDSILHIRAGPIAIDMADIFPQIRSTCPDYIDSCAVLSVTGIKSVCDLGDSYTYKAGRNNQCGQPVEWNYEGPLNIVTSTDSSLTVRFPSFGTYKISVRLRNSCNPMMDSVFVVAASRSGTLDLGRDTSICPGNSMQLHASPAFLSYRWQDGSTDSVLKVSTAGKYWVSVIDSCGNHLSDSILVSVIAKVPIDLGPDRTKCNSDTLHLNAPSGFMNYQWSNNYNINSVTAQNVVVNPLADTAYYIKAEKTPGCFAYDTVRIHVNTSPPINLGVDKSFCSGDSIVFDAGAGFNQYAWSTGATSQTILVKTAGMYSVMGITAEGCKSYDTARVVTVFPNPKVSLDHTDFLCTGSTRTLDAGSFASYLWNDGSTGQKITVNATGTYAVQVTDNNGCKGSDTSFITSLRPLPAGFLPPDTLICSYDKLTLSSKQSYSSYLWNTGSSASSIIISQPGIYWLRVKDAKGCVGRDTVVVEPKDCMEGFYIPTAFTPNSDGKNDVFRPLLFGHVKKYQFAVYNRWGQVVFQTTEPNKSWDGRIAGLPQDTGVFVWVCTYQFEGAEVKTERGTVTLIR